MRDGTFGRRELAGTQWSFGSGRDMDDWRSEIKRGTVLNSGMLETHEANACRRAVIPLDDARRGEAERLARVSRGPSRAAEYAEEDARWRVAEAEAQEKLRLRSSTNQSLGRVRILVAK